ncbi:MAG: hypothetical protein RIQ81_789 [Pseudomonadota bacterium]
MAALGILGALMLWTLSLAFYPNSDGSIATQIPGVWGDWSLHAAHAWWFAEQPPSAWLDVRLLRHDLPMAYPPLINWFSGMLLKTGASFYLAMICPVFLFSMLLVWGLMRLNGFVISEVFPSSVPPSTRNVSVAAFLTCLVVLVGGGSRIFAGLIEYVMLPAHSRWPLMDTIISAARGGILSDPLNQAWLSSLHAQLIPQRTFMAGLSLGVVLVYEILQPQPRQKLLLPLLPLLALAHTYSWLVVLLVIGVTMTMEALRPARKTEKHSQRIVTVIRKWLKIAGPGTLLSVLVFLLVMPSTMSKVSGFGWSPGWMAVDAAQNPFFFWIVNWNVFLPLALVAAVTSREVRGHPLFVSGAILFLAMNLFRLQPWVWDNSKFLLWAMLLMAGPLAGWMLKQVTSVPRRWRDKAFAGVALSLLLVDGLVIISGDLFAPRQQMEIWSVSDQVMGAWARQHLPREALILSPSPEDHRYWAFTLTGRRNVQAYSGWMWTHGLPYEPTRSLMKNMLENPSANLEAIHTTGITHIAVPESGGSWRIDHGGLAQSFKTLIKVDGQAVFGVTDGKSETSVPKTP